MSLSVTLMKRVISVLALVLALHVAPGAALAAETLTFTVRGKALTLTVYRAVGGKPKGTVFMGSGDVGWVGVIFVVPELRRRGIGRARMG